MPVQQFKKQDGKLFVLTDKTYKKEADAKKQATAEKKKGNLTIISEVPKQGKDAAHWRLYVHEPSKAKKAAAKKTK